MYLSEAIEEGNLIEVKKIIESDKYNSIRVKDLSKLLPYKKLGLNNIGLENYHEDNFVSPLTYAIIHNKKDIIDYMIKYVQGSYYRSSVAETIVHGNSLGFTPLHYAVYYGNIETVKTLYENNFIFKKHNLINHPIYKQMHIIIAAATNNAEMLNFLCKKDSEIDIQNLKIGLDQIVQFIAENYSLESLSALTEFTKKLNLGYSFSINVSKIILSNKGDTLKHLENLQDIIKPYFLSSIEREPYIEALSSEHPKEIVDNLLKYNVSIDHKFIDSLIRSFRFSPDKNVFTKNNEAFLETLKKILAKHPGCINSYDLDSLIEGRIKLSFADIYYWQDDKFNEYFKPHIELIKMVKVCYDVLQGNLDTLIGLNDSINLNDFKILFEEMLEERPITYESLKSLKSLLQQHTIINHDFKDSITKALESHIIVKVCYDILKENLNSLTDLGADINPNKLRIVLEEQLDSHPITYESLESLKALVAQNGNLHQDFKDSITKALENSLTPLYELDSLLMYALIEGFKTELISPMPFTEALFLCEDLNIQLNFNSLTGQYTFANPQGANNLKVIDFFFSGNLNYQTPGVFALENLNKITEILKNSEFDLNYKNKILELLPRLYFNNETGNLVKKIINSPEAKAVVKEYDAYADQIVYLDELARFEDLTLEESDDIQAALLRDVTEDKGAVDEGPVYLIGKTEE